MFYKVIKNDKVIDVLDRLVFLKYQKKHNRMIFCNEDEAQAISSSDEKHIWHIDSLYEVPVPGYDTVRIEEIDQYEYEQFKVLNGKSPEDIIDSFVLSFLLNEKTGRTLLVGSLKRLYKTNKINYSEIGLICKKLNIAEEEKNSILS